MGTALEVATITAPDVQPAKPGSRLFSSNEYLRLALCLLIALVTLLTYNPVAKNGFINVDDNGYVVNNTTLHQGLTRATLKWAITTFDCENWHPLTWISMAIDWQLFGKNPAGHHYVSALLHVLNAVLLFLLLEWTTGFTWRSLFVAMLFAVHPVNVESVAWAAERKTVLSMVFFLAGLMCYGWYAKRPSLGRYTGVAVTYALALMAKPQVITFPFVLLLWDYWPLQRFGSVRDADEKRFQRAPFWRLVLEKLPLLLLSAGDAFLTMRAQINARLYAQTYALPGRVENALLSYTRYVAHAVCPVHLLPAYPHPSNALPMWQVLASGAFLLCISLLAIKLRERYFLVGWLWFLGILVPMIGLVQVGDQAMADRYAYIPFIGLFWMLAWVIAETAHKLRIPVRSLSIPASVAVIALCALTARQITIWHDSERLWRYTLSVDRDNFMAHNYLAGVLTEQNRPEEAIQEYLAAERLHSYPLTQVVYFGDYELRHDHAADAMVHAQRVLQGTNDLAAREMAYRDLGVGYTKLSKPAEARENFLLALKIEPRDAYALTGLGLLAYRGNDFLSAADYFAQTAKLDPSDFNYLLVANALQKAGRHTEANAASAQAHKVSKDWPDAQQKALLFLTN